MLKLDESTVLTGSSDGMIRVIGIMPNKLYGLVRAPVLPPGRFRVSHRAVHTHDLTMDILTSASAARLCVLVCHTRLVTTKVSQSRRCDGQETAT